MIIYLFLSFKKNDGVSGREGGNNAGKKKKEKLLGVVREREVDVGIWDVGGLLLSEGNALKRCRENCCEVWGGGGVVFFHRR